VQDWPVSTPRCVVIRSFNSGLLDLSVDRFGLVQLDFNIDCVLARAKENKIERLSSVENRFVIQSRNHGLCATPVRFVLPDRRHHPIKKIMTEYPYLRFLHLGNKNRSSKTAQKDHHEENFYRFICHLDTRQR
jgi:hypothetical protein